MTVAERSPLCVHGVGVNLPSTFNIMKAPNSSLSTFMRKIVQLCPHYECGILNFDYSEPFTIHVHDKIGKVDSIRYQVLKNFKSL
jgi:uncharacterized protein (UPF0276 family)